MGPDRDRIAALPHALLLDPASRPATARRGVAAQPSPSRTPQMLRAFARNVSARNDQTSCLARVTAAFANAARNCFRAVKVALDGVKIVYSTVHARNLSAHISTILQRCPRSDSTAPNSRAAGRYRRDILLEPPLVFAGRLINVLEQVVPRGGIEPPTPAFSVQCSTN